MRLTLDKRTRLEQLLRAQGRLKQLLDGTTEDIRAHAEIALLVVKAEIEVVKAELGRESAN